MGILIGVVAALAAFLGYAATRPESFRVERTTRIAAAPEQIFPLIVDFHRWNIWSPYEKIDPAMKRSHSGPETGTGASYEWDGNRQAGSGRMEITDTSPPSNVTIKLDFTRPFKASNTIEFILAPKDGATDVTWAMHGHNSFGNKVMSVFMSMDKLVGKDFEEGLSNLKAVAESLPA